VNGARREEPNESEEKKSGSPSSAPFGRKNGARRPNAGKGQKKGGETQIEVRIKTGTALKEEEAKRVRSPGLPTTNRKLTTGLKGGID